MGLCPVTSSSSAVEGPPVPRYRPIMRRMQELWKVSSWAPHSHRHQKHSRHRPITFQRKPVQNSVSSLGGAPCKQYR